MTSPLAIALPAEERRSPPSRQIAPPTWWGHLRLLWGLRLTLARASLTRGPASLLTIAGGVVLLAFTAATARATDALFASRPVHASGQMALFLTLLLSFLASTLWITWPVITAGVDDAAELSRFALFPVPGQRLFVASILAALLEPRTLPIWGALLGAAHGFARVEHGHFWFGCMVTVLLAVFCVVWGRVGLHLLLNLFRHRRSAEAMGGGLLILLACSALVPPPDLSWLRNLNADNPTVNDALLRGSIATFSLLPTGGWAWAVFSDGGHHVGPIPLALGYLTWGIAVGYPLAYWLLVRFHRRSGRSLPQSVGQAATRGAYGAGGIDRVLLEREARDLLLNPRARLTIALPFFLTILVKLVGARALALALLGSQCDGWLLGGIASYGALVLGAGFAQNSFGYDGAGAQLYFAAPVPAARVLRAKNIVHGGAALALGLLLIGFYLAYIATTPAWIIVATICNVAFQALLFVSLGNVLSVVAPRKFHPSLKRRDRASALATALGLITATLAVAPGAQLLRSLHGGSATPPIMAAFLLLPAVGLALWRVSIPIALSLLESRRPQLLRAVARE